MPLATEHRAVSEDATLEDFLGNDEESDDETAANTPDAANADPEPAPSDRDADTEDPGAEDDDPETERDGPGTNPEFVATFEWKPGGADCADCGTTVERRWRERRDDETVLVCADCKEW
jgi:hypothetical protein